MKKTVLKLKVSTGKPQFKMELKEGLLLVEVESNPEKGKANKEIIKKLKKILKKDIKIVSGFKSKEKLLEVNSSKEELMEKLKSNSKK